MTPTDEALFIQLWNQGHDTAAIGQQLGIPRGTVSSRAKQLVDQGKIQPRPRGGAYPRQKALARRGSAEVSSDTPPVQYLPPGRDDMRPLLTDILVELRQLTGALAAR